MAATQSILPRDGRLISLILASKGIEDADERVILQLLDFANRYTADVLQSAQSLADHAGRSGPPRIEKDDVELAIQMRRRYEFFEPPPRDYLASLAHELNSQPLPILPETFDLLRLPPPHQRLAEVNFNVVPDSELVFESEGDESVSSESDDEDARTEDSDDGIIKGKDDDGDGEDEEMEEVGVEVAPPVRQDRPIDEDYDD